MVVSMVAAQIGGATFSDAHFSQFHNVLWTSPIGSVCMVYFLPSSVDFLYAKWYITPKKTNMAMNKLYTFFNYEVHLLIPSCFHCHLIFQGCIWLFPKIGVPQNGWFIMENLIKMHNLGVPPFKETPHIHVDTRYAKIIHPDWLKHGRPPKT